MTLSEITPSYLTRPDGVRLAYRHQPGNGPTIIFLPGYMSDMQGSKALALAAWADSEGRAMLRLDYSGCGESDGAFEDGTLDIWRDDVLAVIALAAPGPVLLVGSSMGGWLMLLVALALGDKVKAMVGIAAAPDFTDWDLTDDDRRDMVDKGRIERPSDYGLDPMVVTRAFWESGTRNRQLNGPIAVDCPIRLIHGQHDADVPWDISLQLTQRFRSSNVQTTLIKDGDHRLSRDQDIELLIDVISKVTV